MKTKVIASTLLLAVAVTACENPKQAIGTVGGGALGAWAASNIGKGRGNVVATAVGGVLGALAGGYIGGQLDKADRERADRTTQQALENSQTGQVAQWSNPDSGHSGTITPIRTFQRDGRSCRDFKQAIYIDGKVQEATGVACRTPDGSWKIVQ